MKESRKVKLKRRLREAQLQKRIKAGCTTAQTRPFEKQDAPSRNRGTKDALLLWKKRPLIRVESVPPTYSIYKPAHVLVQTRQWDVRKGYNLAAR